MGTFNIVPDPGMDRLSSGGQSNDDLTSWAEAFGLTDAWRRRLGPTHYSNKTFSRIDFAIVGGLSCLGLGRFLYCRGGYLIMHPFYYNSE